MIEASVARSSSIDSNLDVRMIDKFTVAGVDLNVMTDLIRCPLAKESGPFVQVLTSTSNSLVAGPLLLHRGRGHATGYPRTLVRVL